MNNGKEINKEMIPNIEDVIRKFIKENDISHLDAVMKMAVSINILLNSFMSDFNQDDLLNFINSLQENQKNHFLFSCRLNKTIDDEIQRVLDKIKRVVNVNE